MADVALIIVSAGARVKCRRKSSQSSLQRDRPVPDMFAYSVEQLLEKVRYAKLTDSMTSAPDCAVVCFEYTTPNDIPPKLDTLQRFDLMQDMDKLYDMLHAGEQQLNVYSSTVTGQQLNIAVQRAIKFLRDNPDWLSRTVQPTKQQCLVSLGKDGGKKRDGNKGTGQDIMQQRWQKRKKYEEVSLQKVPSSSKLSGGVVVNDDKGHHDNLPAGQIPIPGQQTPSGKADKVAKKSKMQNDMEDEEELLDEMAQLQADIDFIQNYQWQRTHSPTDLLLRMEYDTASLADAVDASPSDSGTSFCNPVFSESVTRHMLLKNGLGRVSVALSRKKNKQTNHLVADFSVNDLSTYL